MSLNVPPGEPAPDAETPPPAPVENADKSTGTPIDNLDADPGLTDEEIAAEIAKAFSEDDGSSTNENDGTDPLTQQAPDTSGAPNEAEITSTPAGQAPSPDPSTGGVGEGTPSPSPTAVPDGFVDIPGIGVVPQHVAELVDWAGGLTPQQQQAINDLMSGQYHLAPVAPPAASGSGPYPPVDPGGAGAPYQQQAPIQPQPINPDEFTDPDMARLFLAQQQQLAAIQQQQQALLDQQAFQAQQQVHQDRIRTQADIDAGIASFVEAKSLTPQDRDVLVNAAVQMQILPTLQRKHGGNAQSAMTEALEIAYWQTPEFRDRAIQQQLVEAQAQHTDTTTRKGRAAALSGQGASIPRVVPAAVPATKAQRTTAMVADLAEHMNGTN